MGGHLNLDGGTLNLDGGTRPPYNLSTGNWLLVFLTCLRLNCRLLAGPRRGGSGGASYPGLGGPEDSIVHALYGL